VNGVFYGSILNGSFLIFNAMPLPERVIQPVNISRGTLHYQVYPHEKNSV